MFSKVYLWYKFAGIMFLIIPFRQSSVSTFFQHQMMSFFPTKDLVKKTFLFFCTQTCFPCALMRNTCLHFRSSHEGVQMSHRPSHAVAGLEILSPFHFVFFVFCFQVHYFSFIQKEFANGLYPRFLEKLLSFIP